MGLGHTQIGEQERYRFSTHRRATISMETDLAWQDLLLLARVGGEPSGQVRTPAWCQHPADDVTAKDVKDDVEIEVGSFERAAEFGDVPAPKLIGCGGQLFRFLIRRMDALVAPFAGSPSASRIRYMVRVEHKYCPSSSKVAWTAAGEVSWKRVE